MNTPRKDKSMILALTLGTAIGIACHSVAIGAAIIVVIGFFARR